jgi:hypothetical protein
MSSAERKAKIEAASRARKNAGVNMFKTNVNQRVFGINSEPANPNITNGTGPLRGDPTNPRGRTRLPNVPSTHPNNGNNNLKTRRPIGAEVRQHELDGPYIEAKSMRPGNPVIRTLWELRGKGPNATVYPNGYIADLGHEIGLKHANNAAYEIPTSNPPNTGVVTLRTVEPVKAVDEVESVDPTGCFGGTCNPQKKGWWPFGGRRKSRNNKKSKKSKSRKNKKRRTHKRHRV